MKKDNIKDNEIENEEENLIEDSSEKLTETKEKVAYEKVTEETDTSREVKELINDKGDNDANPKKNCLWIKVLLANLIDQGIILGLSGIILVVFDFLIRKIGYMVAIPEQVLLIIYFIVNCIYAPIMKKTKLKKTFAKKILNIK